MESHETGCVFTGFFKNIKLTLFNYSHRTTCWECRGRGYVPCSVCRGSGWLVCPQCEGSTVKLLKILTFLCPPGQTINEKYSVGPHKIRHLIKATYQLLCPFLQNFATVLKKMQTNKE
jgi:hypothetical protein